MTKCLNFGQFWLFFCDSQDSANVNSEGTRLFGFVKPKKGGACRELRSNNRALAAKTLRYLDFCLKFNKMTYQ